MSTLFGNLSTNGLEEATDRLGGFRPLDTDIYTFKIKAMFAGKSNGGATSITFLGEQAGKEYREVFWITNKNGENFFAAKDKTGKPTGKKAPLPGFTIVDDICQIATGKGLSEQDTEDKIVQIWEDGKQVNKAMPMLVETIGQEVALGVLKKLVNKSEKDANGDYQPTAEEREENATDKVFHPEHKLTIVEAKAGADVGAFWEGWVELNKGKTRDGRKYKGGNGQGGAGGAPQSSKAGAPPQAGGDAAPKKSLFGKK